MLIHSCNRPRYYLNQLKQFTKLPQTPPIIFICFIHVLMITFHCAMQHKGITSLIISYNTFNTYNNLHCLTNILRVTYPFIYTNLDIKTVIAVNIIIILIL